jgi:steroid delta-isomerase-like uncharacterized protein
LAGISSAASPWSRLRSRPDQSRSPASARTPIAIAASLIVIWELTKRTAAMYHSAFSDGRFIVQEQMADGDCVVTRWTAAGTHDGELMGMPSTGKAVEIAGITIDRIADDKIAESWTCFDTLGMMQQLGAIPEAQPAGV